MAEQSALARMVDEFNRHPNAIDGDGHPLRLWRTLFEEEIEELRDALDVPPYESPAQDRLHRIAIARECADVVYVVYGIAWRLGIDLDAALREIHRAAMGKIEANVRREDGKVVKPPGFVEPDMTEAVRGC